MGKNWRSQTYGKLNIEEIPSKLQIFYDSHKIYGEPIEITIGTDSQNRTDYTKIVSVISIICKGHGGIFFHRTWYVDVIPSVKIKLETETNISLEVAQKLIEVLEKDFPELHDHCPISIHIDAGNAPYGKTRELIPALVGWVHGMGYECEIKPNAWTASTIADRISK